MPALSVHQQKAARKRRQRHKGGADSTSAPAPHPAALAAQLWLADRPPPSPSSFSPDCLLSPALFDASFIESARLSYTSALPFPHCTLRPLLDGSYCRHLQAACQQLAYTHRRADLYRFDQSSDLSAVAEKSAVIARLRQLLYAAPFRALLESITGVAVSGSLDAAVSMSCAAYSCTHRLLCHDDELQGRRIAYILYLVPDDWNDADGGQLDLFDCQQPTGREGRQQTRPVPISSHSTTRSLLPAFNAFTFFEVTPRSFHAVREVRSGWQQEGERQEGTATPRVRLSISGWFHGEPAYPPSEPLDEDEQGADGSLTCLPPLDSTVLVDRLPADVLSLSHWLSAEYCKLAVCRSVAAHFQDESSVELHHFLHPARYQQLLSAVQALEDSDSDASVGWRRSGPLNRRHYSQYTAAFCWTTEELAASLAERRATLTAAAALLDDFSLFVRSTVFLAWLQRCTGGLRVAALRGEWRRFACGDYTLALDDDSERDKEALDVTLCLFDHNKVKQTATQQPASNSATSRSRASKARQRAVAAEWDEEWGGSVHYIAAGVEDELLCSQPAANTLTIVYRAGSSAVQQQQQQQDEERTVGEESDSGGCIRFTEYVTHRCPTPRFDVDLVCRLYDDEKKLEQ